MSEQRKPNNFIPTECHKNIFEIDYNKLYSEGKKIILFDLDNTIMPYHICIPSKESIELIKSLKEKGFIPIIMSNNHSKRIKVVEEILKIETLSNAKKPFKNGYKRILNKHKDYDVKNIVAIGDQIITDIWGANKMGITSILVKAIYLDNEHWYTKINRFMENKIINKLQKKNIDEYNKIIEIRK